MAFLKVNNYEVSVAEKSAKEENEVIGEQERAFDGTLLSNTRETKRSWKFTTPPLDAQTAEALRQLLLGKGQYWSFDSSSNWYYSSKGLTKASGTATANVLGGKYTGYITIAAAGTVTWDLGSSPYTSTGNNTLMVWTKVAGTWTHYAVLGDGKKYVDGVRNDAASTPFLTVSAGTLTLGDGASVANQDFDDLVALPFLAPADMILAFATSTIPFGPLPRLRATGNFIEDNEVNGLSVEGSDVSSDYVQYQDPSTGAWEGAGRQVSFSLKEA